MEIYSSFYVKARLMKRTGDFVKEENDTETKKKRKLDRGGPVSSQSLNDLLAGFVTFKEDDVSEKSEEEEEEEEKDTLSDSQRRGLDAVMRGESVFITGGAGTGKSFLIEKIKEKLLEEGRSFYVTATTSGAAYNIEGMTLHSFVGIGLGEKDVAYHVKTMKKSSSDKVARWNSIDTLIIDEVSMMSPLYFEKVNQVAKIIRNRKTVPFGGVQLILIGDMLQIPPIAPKVDPKQKVLAKVENQYIFQTPTWRELKPTMIKLDFNFRQQDDDTFKNFLNAVRVGTMTEKEIAVIKRRDIYHKDVVVPEGATRIFSYRADVLRVNKDALDKIDSPSVFYEAEVFESQHITNASQYPVDTRVELKVGASVLLRFNMNQEQGLFNGARGVIVKFVDVVSKKDDNKKKTKRDDEEEKPQTQPFPLVQFDNGEKRVIRPHTWSQYEKKKLISSFTQIPLALSYGMTAHMSQGLTLSAAQVDMRVFAPGQLYVILSRVRRLENLYLTNTNTKHQILADKAVVQFYQKNNLL